MEDIKRFVDILYKIDLIPNKKIKEMCAKKISQCLTTIELDLSVILSNFEKE